MAEKILKLLTINLISLLSLILTGLSGCESGSNSRPSSLTETKRGTANPEAVRFLISAQDAFQDKAYSSALELADSAQHYAPDLADIYFLRGLVYSELRRYDDAEAAYQQVLALDPQYQGVYINLGSTAFRQGDTRKSLKYLKKEYELHPSAQALHQIGRMYAKEGKIDSALYAYQQALELDSLYSLSYFRISELYKEAGDLGKALEYSRRGLQLEPENVNYHHFVGSLLLLMGNAPEAEPHLRKIVEKRPWHYWGNYNLGQALLRLGKTEEGESYIKKAEELQKELKNIQEWEQLAENNPDQLMLWVNLGDAYRRAERYEEAIEAFNIALNLEPRFVALENNLANLYIIQGDTASALFHYRSILQRFPDFTDVWLNMGVVYANAGNKTEARNAWQKVLEITPNDATAKAYLKKLEEME